MPCPQAERHPQCQPGSGRPAGEAGGARGRSSSRGPQEGGEGAGPPREDLGSAAGLIPMTA